MIWRIILDARFANDIRKFAKWFTTSNGERFAIGRVTTRDITDFRNYLRRDQNQAVATVNRNLVTLRRFFGWLVEHGHIAANPAKPVKELRKTSLHRKDWTGLKCGDCCVRSNSEPTSERRRFSPSCCIRAVGSAISSIWTSMT